MNYQILDICGKTTKALFSGVLNSQMLCIVKEEGNNMMIIQKSLNNGTVSPADLLQDDNKYSGWRISKEMVDAKVIKQYYDAEGNIACEHLIYVKCYFKSGAFLETFLALYN